MNSLIELKKDLLEKKVIFSGARRVVYLTTWGSGWLDCKFGCCYENFESVDDILDYIGDDYEAWS